MNEIQQLSHSNGSSALMLELAKSLKLVAPISMGADAQMVWLQAAVDALEDIRADEVSAVSAELRRSVTRPSQIVPEIAKLVHLKRQRATLPQLAPGQVTEWEITKEAQHRRAISKNQGEVEAAWQWERDERQANGFHNRPLPKPLTASEIAKLSPAMKRMGLKCGALVRSGDGLVDAG